MALPFFYFANYVAGTKDIVLDEETSRHVVQVLRMKGGEALQLTDGKGNIMSCVITEENKKHCGVKVTQSECIQPASRRITIAISLIKNANRFEWFLEKATEIGVAAIIPIICARTEKEKFRHDRMQGILISAMLQSQQCWLPELPEPILFKEIVESAKEHQRFIAHCLPEEKRNLTDMVNESLSSQIIVIGPEGDFTKDEVDLARQHHFIAVGLGGTRLRTETAGIVAAALLKNS